MTDLKKLTIDEKIEILMGKNTWETYDADGKLDTAFLADGPSGLRMNDVSKPLPYPTFPATSMPTLSCLANSWDRELLHLDGQTIADDCIERGADVLLAPGVNIKRTPLCGRNFEYFSEDPLLTGELAKAFIEGVQKKGIGTSLKHFAANNREYNRHSQSSEVDERTLREIYLPAFEKALEADPWTVMCSYNRLNGIWTSENEWLLKEILRGEFGFDGLIVSDWGATHNAWRALKATLDLTMPTRAENRTELREALREGIITEAELDERAEKVLELVRKARTAEKRVSTTKEERHAIAVKLAQESLVLLKNEDNILPLKPGKILVDGLYKNEAVTGGGGSSFVVTDYKQKPLRDEICERMAGVEVFSTKAVLDSAENIIYPEKIYEAAYSADTVILCMGTDRRIESEGRDRSEIRLTRTQEDIIIRTADVNENLVVVLEAGSAIDVSPWIDRVKAVLYASYSGEGGNEAIADVLTGRVCPTGKLAETFPLCLEDTPTKDSFGNGSYERYEEGVFVGYRYYDSKGLDVAFPFGHGLSYAGFEYSDLELIKTGDTDFEVSFNVRNVSDVDAKEICQLYVRDPFSYVSRPEKELRAFTKVSLAAGESRRVTLTLGKRAFAYYSVPMKRWHVEKGDFEILVGASSRDIRLKERIRIELPKTEQYTL